jgi:hypothetical protein
MLPGIYNSALLVSMNDNLLIPIQHKQVFYKNLIIDTFMHDLELGIVINI